MTNPTGPELQCSREGFPAGGNLGRLISFKSHFEGKACFLPISRTSLPLQKKIRRRGPIEPGSAVCPALPLRKDRGLS